MMEAARRHCSHGRGAHPGLHALRTSPPPIPPGSTPADAPALFQRWGRWRRLSDDDAALAAVEWARVLGVGQEVRLERVHRAQVTDQCGRRGCSLVGVTWDAEQACVYHTRALMGEDLVHEMLHVAHPDWSESEVVRETERLVGVGKRRTR